MDFRHLLAVLAFFAVMSTLPFEMAAAQQAPQRAAVDQDVASARAAYEQAEALIAQGRFDEAQKRVARIPRTNDYARVYGAFLDGRLAESTGRLTRARDIYRAILNTYPSLARVRLHLARVLTQLEDADAARHHYDFVLGAPDIAAPLAERVRTDVRALECAGLCHHGADEQYDQRHVAGFRQHWRA